MFVQPDLPTMTMSSVAPYPAPDILIEEKAQLSVPQADSCNFQSTLTMPAFRPWKHGEPCLTGLDEVFSATQKSEAVAGFDA